MKATVAACLFAAVTVVLYFKSSTSAERAAMLGLGRLVVLDDAPADDSTENLRHYLRASSDSIAYSCGGKEVGSARKNIPFLDCFIIS